MSRYYVATKPTTLGRVLKEEASPLRSRRDATILAGDGADREVETGAVLGAVLFADPVITPDGGNTGDGALGSLTYGNAVKVGDYVATCIAAAADGGRFQVVDPDGYCLADAEVGVAYSSPQLAFTISDGAADFVVGDTITVTVGAGSGKVLPIDFSSTDGSQLAHAIATRREVAPDGTDANTVVLVRDCVVAEKALVWPDGATEQQKGAALSRLADVNNIQTVTEA